MRSVATDSIEAFLERSAMRSTFFSPLLMGRSTLEAITVVLRPRFLRAAGFFLAFAALAGGAFSSSLKSFTDASESTSMLKRERFGEGRCKKWLGRGIF